MNTDTLEPVATIAPEPEPTPAIRAAPGDLDKRALATLCAGHFTVDLCQGVLPLTLPFLFTKLRLDYTAAAFVITTAYLTSSVAQPLFGVMRHRRARRFMPVAGVVLACASLACIALASSYAGVLVATVFSMLGVAAFHPEGAAQAHAAAGTVKPGRGMAYFAVSGSLGFSTGALIFGPLLAWRGLPATWGLLVPGAVVATLLWRSPAKERDAAKTAAASGLATDRKILIGLALIVTVAAARQWVQAGTMTFLPLFYTNHLGMAPAFAAGLLLALSLGNDCGTLACGWLGERFGYRTNILVALAVTGPLLIAMHFLRGPGLYGLLFLMGISQAMPVLGTTMIGQRLLPRNKALAASLTLGFGSGLGGIASGLLGVIADARGVPASLWCLAAVPFLGVIAAAFLPRDAKA